MDALSAIRLPYAPDLTRSIPQALTDGAPQAIPLRETATLGPGAGIAPAAELSGTGASSFASTLGRMVAEVSGKQAAAAEAAAGVLTSQGVPLHQAVIAMEEASVSFQLMVEVRNKLLESYQELMRMQV